MVSRAQLRGCGVSGSAISRWARQGRLPRIHRGVYAVGHRALPLRGRLVAALLYAGPGAALSHQTAGWWWGLIASEPKVVHISAPRRTPSLPQVRIHNPLRLDRVRRNRLPVTTPARTLLDLAATMPLESLRRALAEADFRHLLRLTAIERQLGRGRRGAAALRGALEHHQPELACARSPLELRFLRLVERAGLPVPELNRLVAGHRVDALWPDTGLVAEPDGGAAHGSVARMRDDRHRDLALRRAGFEVVR